MSGYMWFGNKLFQTWIPAPAVNVDASKVDWNSKVQQLNGGAYVARSAVSHKEYQFSWNLADRDSIRTITDFADGVYGPGPFYWADPFTMDKNVLPQAFATPYLNGRSYGGPYVSNFAPALTLLGVNPLQYPVYSARFPVVDTDYPSVWVPVPAGYTFWVGAHGPTSSVGNNGLVVTPDGGSAVNVAIMDVADTNRFNYSVNNVTGVSVKFFQTDSGAPAGTGRIQGVIAQVLPNGVAPLSGGFISGQGHAGCEFETQPTVTQYNAVLDKVGATAKLTEVW